jgi:cellulose synthase/poly-beta-1,6-N-acetylglucosamine synthase-like glycosyltransferase
MIALWIALGFSLCYFLLQAYYLLFWSKAPKVSIHSSYTPTEGVTVVIVARNEAQSIEACLQSILRQQYPDHLYEIIVVDDHSTDNTSDVVKGIADNRIRIFQLKDYPAFIKAPAYKKSGITLAVDKAKYETVIVTDADCMHEENWLRTIMYAFQHDAAVFMTAPVLLNPGKSMLEKMQETEQLTLMLITGAGITSALHDLANGANMAFRKSAFAQVNGYQGNEQYASGDDMFLIEKMRAAFPDKISFVKSTDATVYTSGKKDWASLLKQRLRWAGKNKGLGNKTINRIWVFVGAYQILLVVLLLTAIFHFTSSWPFLLVFCAKWTADYMLIATSAAFFKRTAVLRYFVPLQFFYTYYILRLGLMMILGKKGDWELR